jgi:peptidoglycan/LPS O-acetylase OafA/YrhL
MSSLATHDLTTIDAQGGHPIPVPPLRQAEVPQTDGRFYRPELDVLRFFAFLSVFFYHGLPGLVLTRHTGLLGRLAACEIALKEVGRFGVCLFFLLSAYLITELLSRERNRTGTIHITSFYSRRILRIWPLYFAFLFGGVLLGLFVRDYKVEASRLWAFLLLAGNWYVVRVGCSANPIAPLWSVSVEEQFYLLWPWVARLGGRTLCLTSVLLFPISSVCLYELSREGVLAGRTIWLNSFVQFQFFAIGALLALALRGRALILRPAVRIGLFVAGLTSWLVADGVFQIDRTMSTGPFSMVTGYACVAIGCTLLFGSFLGLSRRWLPKPLVYLGKVSYGLYVFHMLALNISWALFWPSEAQRSSLATSWAFVSLTARAGLVLIVGLGTTVALAALSYRFLERPFLNLKQRFTFIPSRRT